MANHINDYTNAWTKYHQLDEEHPDRKQYEEFALETMTWTVEQPERTWELILAIYPTDISKKVEAALAAGPLEDLLSLHGSIFINRVVALAESDKLFNHLLGGVWKNDMTPDVWSTVQKVRKDVW